jgi:formylglycine-generating enzyme required for sulfatase activity
MRVSSCVWLGVLLCACGSTQAEDGPETLPDAGSDARVCDADGDGHLSNECGGEDCDDARADVHPGATDICDGDDNDCDGETDPGDVCDCAEPPPEPTVPFSERVCLAGGWFWMGMARTDPDAHHYGYWESPVHEVFVSPFYLDQYEVTNRRYLECLDAGVCEVETNPLATGYWDVADHSTDDMLDRPFLGGSALDAEKFCEWVGGWLPSEAQWERAAAGLGDEPRPYPSGYWRPTCEEEWASECVDPPEMFPKARRVGLKKPNPEGIYDLGGNAHEYAADLFSIEAYEQCHRCKNPCFGCAEKTGADADQPGPDPEWPWGHAARGAAIQASFSDGGPDSLSSLVFFRSQMRDRVATRQGDAMRAPDLFNRSFRCAYRARPKG